MTSLDPLSQESHESKLGMRRLMAMQAQLKTRSIVAEQGYMILKKLISLVVQKEMEKMLEVPEPYDEETHDSGHLRDEVAVRDNTSETQTNLGTALSLTDTGEGFQGGLDTNFLPSSEELDALSFDFYEDPTVTQALIDFEQVMNYPPSDQPDEATFGAAGPEYATGSCFGGQDQNWIWGQNLRL
ncbi:Tall aerial hyphae-4 [Lasiodiplodia theobromae]|uniref:Tall aerial hyphae-4 n=1 Tax=Lasiodiplodia theobromae TaxID=45133 RepID=UPI0015C38892|nr:Tall aerial hyphae-4 [Lasiodiplodia theobromae]KAF4543385.1 Tall aerial hyphae-4 [Lasiodiplodia theobromae]